MQIIITREWAVACGMRTGEADRTFTIKRINEQASKSTMGTCYVVLKPDGTEWTVFECRCQPIQCPDCGCGGFNYRTGKCPAPFACCGTAVL